MNFKSRFNQKYKQMPGTFGGDPSEMLRDALKHISTGKSALDLGAGNGRNVFYLLSNGFEVTGVDISKEGLELIKERAEDKSKINLVVSDVTDFDTDEKFDLVTATGLLHFLQKDQIDKVISNMQKFTKSGGVNVIGAKMQQNYRGDLPHVFEPDELRSYYDNGSWKIIEYSEKARRKPAEIATIIAKKK